VVSRRTSAHATALWGAGGGARGDVLRYTVGDDAQWDARLVRWDVLGSLGHVEGLAASGLLSRRSQARLRGALRDALRAVDRGRLRIEASHEDAHTAVELWITKRLGEDGARLHTGRSRNDQIACDLRLYLKDRLLALHGDTSALVSALLAFAAKHRSSLWPGYTHGRRAMPSSAGAWAAAFADGMLMTLEGLPAVWARVDRSPLGSGAGYGVPLPLDREAAARALGFARVEHVPATVQNGRGKLEATVLAWCSEIAHEVSRLASDAVALSGEETGFLVIPPELSTGSSLMPHKRNPDVFEVTRARAALVDAHLIAVLQLKSKLHGGYNRDVQLLKPQLFGGIDTTSAMLQMTATAVPRLAVDRVRSLAGLDAGTLSTDEVLRRAEAGIPFRTAYRDVAAAIGRGEAFARPAPSEILRRRRSTGGLGNLGLPSLRARLARERRWARVARARFDAAMSRLAG
jgi:argininosuccinate lyase